MGKFLTFRGIVIQLKKFNMLLWEIPHFLQLYENVCLAARTSPYVSVCGQTVEKDVRSVCQERVNLARKYFWKSEPQNNCATFKSFRRDKLAASWAEGWVQVFRLVCYLVLTRKAIWRMQTFSYAAKATEYYAYAPAPGSRALSLFGWHCLRILNKVAPFQFRASTNRRTSL